MAKGSAGHCLYCAKLQISGGVIEIANGNNPRPARVAPFRWSDNANMWTPSLSTYLAPLSRTQVRTHSAVDRTRLGDRAQSEPVITLAMFRGWPFTGCDQRHGNQKPANAAIDSAASPTEAQTMRGARFWKSLSSRTSLQGGLWQSEGVCYSIQPVGSG